MQLPDVGLLEVSDVETGSKRLLDTSSAVVRFEYEQDFHRHNNYVKDVFKKAGADLLHMRAGDDYVKVLQKFFINRSR